MITPVPQHLHILSTTLSFALVVNIGSSKSPKSSKNGSLILAGRNLNAYDLNFVKERTIKPIESGASAPSPSINSILSRDQTRFRLCSPPNLPQPAVPLHMLVLDSQMR